MNCRSKGILFEDPYFPADGSSLFVSEKLPFTPKWLRPKVGMFYQSVSVTIKLLWYRILLASQDFTLMELVDLMYLKGCLETVGLLLPWLILPWIEGCYNL